LRGSARALRAAAGALLALALVLICSVPATAFVTRVVIDSVADFSGGTFQRTGLISNPAGGVDGVQLMPIGLSGEWVTDARRLPIGLQELTTTSWGDYLFVVGGRRADNNASGRVFCLRLNADGSVAAISNGAALPKGLIGASSFVMEVGDQPYLYVVGGLEAGTTISGNLYRGAINPATGLVGDWTDLPGGQLPFPLYYSALATSGRYVYLIGGIGYAGELETVPNLFRAYVSETTGDLTGWTDRIGPGGLPSVLPPSFSAGVAASQALVYEGEAHKTLYLIGGRSQALNQTQGALTAVGVAQIGEDGNLSEWREPGLDLPVSLHGHGAVMVDGNEVLLAGGLTNLNDPKADIGSNVKAALVDPDDQSFPLVDWDPAPDEWNVWQTGVPFPGDQMRVRHGMVQVGQWVYAIGGSDSSNTATDTIFRGSIAGVGALYAPSGTYESAPITVYGGSDPALAPDLLRLEWDVTLPYENEVALGSVMLEYSWRPAGGTWTEWVPLGGSVSGANTYAFAPSLSGAAQFRFRSRLDSAAPHERTPRIDAVRLVYDAAPADLALNSLTATKAHVRPGDTFTYTASYQNVGGVAAEHVTIALSLPPYLSSLSSEWIETGPGSHVYAFAAGAVPAGSGGTAGLTVRVGQVPEGATSLQSTATGSFPDMMDLDGNWVGDPNPANDSAVATVSATPLAVVGAVTAAPVSGSRVSPGDAVEYRLTFRLQGANGTSGLVISAPVDTTKLSGITPLDGGLLEGSTVRWYYMGPVASGFEATVRLQAKVRRPLANGTPIVVTFSGASTDLPTAPLGTAAYTVVAQPRLTLSGVADPSAGNALTPGQSVVYRFAADNTGGEAASSAALVVSMGPGVVPLSAEPAASIAGSTVSWALGTLGVDSPRELKITARVDDNTLHGQALSAVAQLSAGGAAPADAQIGHTVRIPARLTVSKVVEPAQTSVLPGGLLGYKLVVANAGGEVSGPVLVTDRLPAYTKDVEGRAPHSTLTWEVGSLDAGQSATVSYRVQVADPLSESVRVISGLAATANDGIVTGRSGTTQTPVSHYPNLWVTLADGQAAVRPGDVLTYTVSYGNRGGPTTDVGLAVTLGPGLEWRNGGGWQSVGGGQYRLQVGTLGTETRSASFQAAIAADVPVNDPTVALRAEATIAGAVADADPYDNRATDLDIVSGPDLAVVALEVSPTKPVRDQYLTLRVTIGNVGVEGLRQYALVDGLDEVLVEVYVRPSVSPPPSGPTDSLGGYCADAGCSVPRPVFRQTVPVDALQPGMTATVMFPTLLQLRETALLDLYAQVDVGGSADYGRFREGNEENNLMSLRRFPIAELGPEAGSYHLPLVANNAVGH